MSDITYVTKPTEKAREAEKAVKRAFETLGSDIKEKLVLAIGGDGTMLRAVREHSGDDVIFVGISAGSLGLLQTVEVDEDMMFRTRYARGDVVVGEVGHAVGVDQPVAGGEVDPRLPLLRAHLVADGAKIGSVGHARTIAP